MVASVSASMRALPVYSVGSQSGATRPTARIQAATGTSHTVSRTNHRNCTTWKDSSGAS